MDRFIGRMLNEFEAGKMSRRTLIQTLAVAATAFGMGEEMFAADPQTFGFSTICVNHISYQVSGTDYGKARDWYVKLFGMETPMNVDDGGQAYLPFGPKDAGTFMLPRGGRDPNAGPPPERNAGGAAGRAGRGAGGASGAAGRGAGRGGAGGGQAERVPLTVTVDQVGYTVADFNVKKAGEALKKFGLDAKQDGESFHVVDPFGMDVQISGNKLSAY